MARPSSVLGGFVLLFLSTLNFAYSQCVSAPTITGVDTGCIGGSFTYTTESGMSNYQWTFDPGNTIIAVAGSQNTNAITVTFIGATGARTLSVKYTDGNGCTPTTPTSKTITAIGTPMGTITGTQSVCINSTQTYSTQAGHASYNWSIFGGTITSGEGTSTIQVTWTTAGNTFVGLSYISSLGCGSPPSRLNVIVTGTSPSINGPAVACMNQQMQFYTTSGKSNYNWTAPEATIYGQGTFNPSFVWVSPGTKTISVSYSDPLGCTTTSTSSYTVTVKSPVTPTISGTTTVCSAVPTPFTTESGMTAYSWSISPWGIGGNVVSGGTTYNPSVAFYFNPSASATFSVAYTDADGCRSETASTLITIKSVSLPTLTGPSQVCKGTGGHVYTTDVGKPSYNWEVGPGGAITSGAGTNSITVSWAANAGTTGVVAVTYGQDNGCTSRLTSKSTTLNAPITPIINATAYGNLCVGETRTYYTQTGHSNYQWTIPAGATILNGQGTAQIDVSFGTSGTSSVSVIFTTVKGCTAATAGSIATNVYARPVPTITGPSEVCLNSSNVFYTEFGKSSYYWTIDGVQYTGPGYNTNSISSVWFGTTTPKVLAVTYRNDYGCAPSTPTTQTVIVKPLPVPTITGDNVACLNTTNNIYTTESGKTEYLWTGSTNCFITSGQGTNQIRVSWFNNTNPGYVTVRYKDASGCQGIKTHNVSVNGPSSQSITFNTLAPVTIGSLSFDLNATSSSGLPVAYTSSNSAVASISGKTVTIHSLGATTITATQPGNTCISAASPVARALNVVKRTPLLTFTSSQYATYGVAKTLATATDGSTGVVSYTVTNGTGTAIVSGNILSPTGAGDVTVTASISSDANNNPTTASQVISIQKASPVVAITSVANGSYNSTIALSTSTGGSTGPVSYSVVNGTGTATLSGSILTLTSPGVVTVTASVAADANYNASIAQQEISIVKASPSVSITSASSGPYLGTMTLTANAGGSTGGVSYSVTNGTGSATLSGNILTLTSAGTITVTANVSADANYFAGTGTQLFNITKINPTIAITSTNTGTFGSSITLTASSGGSTGAITYSLTNGTGSASLNGNLLTLTGAGIVQVSAAIAADKNYNSVVSPTQAITIVKATPVVVITSSNQGTYLGSISLSSTKGASTGAVSYSVLNGTGSATVSGSNLSLTGAGTVTVTASVAADANYFASTGTQTVTINKALPTVVVTSTNAGTSDGTISLTATKGGSPGTLSFSVSNGTGSASVSGNNLLLNSAGTVTVTATVASDANYLSNSTTQVITIYSIPLAVISGSNAICSSAITLSGSANSSDCSYLWSTGATTQNISVSSPGTYTLQVTNGAGYSVTSAAKVITSLLTTISASNISVCTGPASVALTATPTGGTWSGTGVSSNAFSPLGLSTGNYTATYSYSNSGCVSTKSITVTVIPSPSISSMSGAAAVCNGNNYTYSVNATGTSLSYSWTYPSTYSININSGASLSLYIPTGNNTYGPVRVTVTAGNGCSMQDGITTYPGSCSSMLMSVYPNPAEKEFVVEMEEAEEYDYDVTLYNDQGKAVGKKTVNKGQKNISFNTEELPNGTYLLKSNKKDGGKGVRVLVMKGK